MAPPFHRGELLVQERAGVRAEAEKVARILRSEIPEGADAWLGQRELAVVAAVDAEGRAWASLLAAVPGFLQVEDARRLRVAALPGSGDPLRRALASDGPIGLLAIDLATRRRMRVNGLVATIDAAGFVLCTRQVYGNCPKYIQSREPVAIAAAPADPPPARLSTALDADLRRFVSAADTFFVGSVHPEAGADASHRGGEPGFVRVLGPDRLAIPDYDGNRMFNTLGNLAVDPRVGLVFAGLDEGPDAGRVLQISGSAAIDFDPARAAAFPGAQRVLDVRIARAVDRPRALGVRYRLREPSPFNPPLA
ncbi:MAG TPA: pyridoxamine 5'-phosphate oxidase family protein [Myxococcota bacterium]|jgi:predicted pyridoxine 5'-phosphate oxidase superfamily flavin-nucleotide-binding protein|nr:pyridoxamine 5'-phosphate oxidase family protein [Myxococcota bacterium]